MTDVLAEALAGLAPFRTKGGRLTGEPVTPWQQTGAYQQWAEGSIARAFVGALAERGTAGMIGGRGASPLPDLGELDPAPAMAMALGEADYIVRSYGTVIAWHLGPEVYGVPGSGEWVQVIERCCRDYAFFSASTSRHQAAVRRALASLPVPA